MNKSLTKALAECRQAWEAHPDATWAWCLHHGVMLELLIEPYQARIAYILKRKPKHEQVTRLNNFRPVVSKLPAKIIKLGEAHEKARKAHVAAYEVHDKAWEAYDKAREAHVEAWEASDKARKACREALGASDKAREACREAILANTTKLQALHTKDVPHHTWNGRSIF